MTTASVLRGTTYDTRAFAPYLQSAIPDQSMNVFTVVALNLAFYLKGGTGTTYSMTNIPTGLTLNASTGLLSGTVTTGQTLSCIATATNTLGAASDTLSWIVTQTLTWAALPSPLNVPQNSFFDLAPYISGGTPTNITDAVALPANVSISMPPNSPTPRLVASTSATVGAFTDNNVFTLVSGSSSAAVADWNARTISPDVVWFHDFQTAAEVNQFRWAGGYGTDPNDITQPGKVYWDQTDGITGKCLAIKHGADRLDPPHWWRPFSPIAAPGNGKAVSDPGANGTIPTKTYNSADNNVVYNWLGGNFGHQDYWDADFIGDSFFLQIRKKADLNSTRDGVVQVGKFYWITNTRNTSTRQQIVCYANASNLAIAEPRPFNHNLYKDVGAALGPNSVGSTNNYECQRNSDLASGTGTYCEYTRNANLGACWTYSGGWDTLLYQIVPGHDGVADTVLRCWAQHDLTLYPAEAGAYRKIWDVTFTANYDVDTYTKRGRNALVLANYRNMYDINTPTLPYEITFRFAQVILSKSTIPAPTI